MLENYKNSIKFQSNNDDINSVLNMIDEYDKQMLAYIIELHNSLKGDVLNINKFENVIEALQHINAENEYDYLNCLLHPEKSKGVKIPSPIPVPSCAFQLHNTITLSTNSLGNLCFLFNPYFLYNNALIGQTVALNESYEATVNYATSFFFNNNDSLDGRTPSLNTGNWSTVNIGQGIPGVYNQYRLVSASIVVRYIGRMDITSGVIGGAIIYDESINPVLSMQVGNAAISIKPANLVKYANFDLAMDSFYHQETNCIKGLRELYFPLDNTYEEYVKTADDVTTLPNGQGDFNRNPTISNDFARSGFQQFVYVLGAPPNSSCFKVDIYCNFETLPNASFLNYMPVSLSNYNVSPTVKKQSISVVQKSPITNLQQEHKWYGNIKGKLFDGLKRVWKSGIPTKVIQNITPFLLPYLKPALSFMNMYGSSLIDKTNSSFANINPNVVSMINNSEKDDNANVNNIMLIGD